MKIKTIVLLAILFILGMHNSASSDMKSVSNGTEYVIDINTDYVTPIDNTFVYMGSTNFFNSLFSTIISNMPEIKLDTESIQLVTNFDYAYNKLLRHMHKNTAHKLNKHTMLYNNDALIRKVFIGNIAISNLNVFNKMIVNTLLFLPKFDVLNSNTLSIQALGQSP